MNYYKSIFLKSIKSKKFFLSIMIIILSMGFSLTAYFEEGMEYFFKHDYVMTFLQGYDGDRTLFVILAPLIATIPFAARHIENRKSGSIKYVVSRMGEKRYFNSIFIMNMILSFVTFFIGMIIFLLIAFVFFNKNINMHSYSGITRITTYHTIANMSPLLYIFAIIIHCAVVSMAYSSVGLALSYFIKNKFVAWISPFIIATVGSLFALFIGITKFEPMAIFDVSRVQGTSVIFVLVYLILVIGVSYIVSYNKFKKDMKADEEI